MSKKYAYVMLHGVNGTVIRAHGLEVGDRLATDPNIFGVLCSWGYVPEKEIILPNSGMLLAMVKTENNLRGTAKKTRARKAG